MLLDNLHLLDAMMESIVRASRTPGAAVAVVSGEQVVFAKGYGYRDLHERLPLTVDTTYPIASTTKAMNATLLALLVEQGLIAWDAPVQRYLPRFRMSDALRSTQVTVRDLVTMRTGLPRHDWVWVEQSIDRPRLVEVLPHLELTCGLRERFQYNNLTVSIAGHIAEVVAGQSWEQLIRERLFEPLGMHHSGFDLEHGDNSTRSYHESAQRELLRTPFLKTALTAPSGGVVWSTIADMVRWVAFNLKAPAVLAEIHTPQLFVGNDPACPSPGAAYAMGWFSDRYNGHRRLSHGGNLNDINSDVSLFPDSGLGVVSFINFGGLSLAKVINEYAFDVLLGLPSGKNAEAKLAQYEQKIIDTRQRRASAVRVENARPSHPLEEYIGAYEHPAYGAMDVHLRNGQLLLGRGQLDIPLQHWHYDAWAAEETPMFPIHATHPFDQTSPILFETGSDGAIAALTLHLEPSLTRIRFTKQYRGSS